jgi:hypothetical protein
MLTKRHQVNRLGAELDCSHRVGDLLRRNSLYNTRDFMPQAGSRLQDGRPWPSHVLLHRVQLGIRVTKGRRRSEAAPAGSECPRRQQVHTGSTWQRGCHQDARSSTCQWHSARPDKQPERLSPSQTLQASPGDETQQLVRDLHHSHIEDTNVAAVLQPRRQPSVHVCYVRPDACKAASPAYTSVTCGLMHARKSQQCH